MVELFTLSYSTMSQKVIIYGATSWIGLQLLKEFVARGDKVGALWRNETRLQELKATYKDNIETQVSDITDIEKANTDLQNLIEKMGGVDLFILSSWIGYDEEYADFSFDLDKKVIDTNVVGWTNTMTYMLHYFVNKKAWHLVWISSIAAMRGLVATASYSATKAYNRNYLEAMRLYVDARKLPITITDLQPGFIDTPLVPGKALWKMPVEKAVKYMLKAIDKKKRHTYIPPKWSIIAWFMKWMPYSLYKKMDIKSR